MKYLLPVFALLFSCATDPHPLPTWSVMMHQPNQDPVRVTRLPADLSREFLVDTTLAQVQVTVSLRPKADYTIFRVTGSSTDRASVYFSLQANYGEGFTPYNFNGPVDSAEIYRQSPHDVDAWIVNTIAMQAVPTVALRQDSTFYVALNGSPALYDNFTSQAFYPEQRQLSLSSGDNGSSPGLQPDTAEVLTLDYNAEKTQRFTPGKVLAHYHPVSPEQGHAFEGILFQASASELNGLRKAITVRSADHFSRGRYSDYFGALAFTTAYMNLRTNDSGKSKYWVVPAVEYSNTQYGRDAFWIATLLDPEYSAEALKSELQQVNHFAEYPLFAIIWAYRAQLDGMEVNKGQAQAYVDAIEERARNDQYYSYYEGDGRLDFQYWGDLMAFEKDDVVTYNQGLFALALTVAQKMGLTVRSDPEAAAQHYRDHFDPTLGYYPISKYKAVLGPDPLVPDLLSQVYLGEPLLESSTVQRHYDRMVKYSKTPYGFKIVATPEGAYLPAEAYDIAGYVSQVNREDMPDGRYFRGGSYFLYDNLFLIDAYLHGVEGAEEMLIWRVTRDFEIGSTTYETLNTLNGEPWKPNMGWNVAVYAIWRKLMDEGKADGKLLEAVDEIVGKD
ncbi:MAG: hypothetical protein WA960_04365 [Tunicatimonas sp.]